MGFVLDSVLKEHVVVGPETVSANYTTKSINIQDRELEYSIQAVYNNGINVNMTWALEASNDENTWTEVGNSQQIFTDPTGSILYDMAGSGFAFIRIKITVTTGSIDIQDILYIGKRRH